MAGHGFYFSPRASYYTKFTNCVCADNPFYGFYAKGNGSIHNLQIQNCFFVRNGGGFLQGSTLLPCAVLFDGISNSEIKNCLFDSPGTFWYYQSTAKCNKDGQPSSRKTVALQINGNFNRIIDNTFLNSSCESIIINGDGNILLNNIVDNTVVINGTNNYISNLVFTNQDAKLVLKGNAINSTKLFGISDERIIKQ